MKAIFCNSFRVKPVIHYALKRAQLNTKDCLKEHRFFVSCFYVIVFVRETHKNKATLWNKKSTCLFNFVPLFSFKIQCHSVLVMLKKSHEIV